MNQTVSETEKLRLEVAERHLAALQSFHPRIDGKVSAIFAVSSAQLALVAVNVTMDDFLIWYKASLAAAFIVITVAVHVNLYLSTYPQLAAGSRAFTFFGHVSRMGEAEFISEYTALTVDQLLHDFSRQIWRNSQIVAAKYHYLKIASISLFISLIPWTLLLAILSLSEWKLPNLTQ